MNIKARVREWLESLLYAGVVVCILFLVFWPFRVDGSSMETSFRSGDRVIVSRLMFRLGNISAGDVIVCKVKEGNRNIHIMKRLAGLPGDHVQIINGKVLINNNELKEPYLGNTSTVGNIDVLLDDNEFFILGDNRETSSDSRHIGPVMRDKIIGKVILKWYPINFFELY